MGFVILFEGGVDFEPEIVVEDSWKVVEDKDMEKGTYKDCREAVDLTFLLFIIYCIINLRQKYLKATNTIYRLYLYLSSDIIWCLIMERIKPI